MDMQRRKTRLIELIDRMTSGADVAQRDMKAVLSQQQFDALQERWNEQKQLREDTREKPGAIVEYEERLKKALFEYAKAEGYSGSTHRKQVVGSDGKRTGTKAYRRAESAFESLIEYLEECLTADPGLCVWFDRQIVFGPEGDLGLSPSQMPRVVTSRSLDRLGDGRMVGVLSKREVKQMALEEALAEVVATEERMARIAARIAEEEAAEEAARSASQRELFKLLRNKR